MRFTQIFRSLLGFAFLPFGQQMFKALNWPSKFCMLSSLPFRTLLLPTPLPLESGSRVSTKLLAGLAIVLGIPFPIWIYYNGEAIRMNSKLKP